MCLRRRSWHRAASTGFGRIFDQSIMSIRTLQLVSFVCLSSNIFLIGSNNSSFTSQDELKKKFWHEVLPAASTNESIDDEAKEYFADNVFITTNAVVLDVNEPKHGRDYKYFDTPVRYQEASGSSQSDEADEEPLNGMTGRIKPNFEDPVKSKTNFFGMEDSDTDTEGNCINVTTASQVYEIETDDIDGNFLKCFNAVLSSKTAMDKLTKAEVLELLQDEDVASDSSFVSKVPSGVQKFMAQFSYLKDETFEDNEERDSMLVVPSISNEASGLSSSGGNVLIDSSNTRTLRSKPPSNLNLIDSKRAAAIDQSRSPSTPSRSHRSRKENTEGHNSRMNFWMKSVNGNSKRPRDSVSPQ